MIKEFTRDEYAECVDTDFVFSFSPEYKVTMKLIEVTAEIEKFRQRTYVLTFTAPEDTPIVQGMAAFENEKIGQTQIFIVPVGKDSRGVIFESVFNKLLDPA
ncbi:MAG TPA: hypothetical protein VGO50_02985 [Pyrinomonadaceae bacterium]|jgi:hypothetical protein|nr:hypothetical protein [Pyrinomonadaceae bacterium]